MEQKQEKKKYKRVQLLAWEIYTGPVLEKVDDGSGGEIHIGVDYSGIRLRDGGRLVDQRWDPLAQCIDIEARLEATRRALETALLWADPAEDVLKVFVAPEFLYRGPAGAYLNDLLDGWEGPPPFTDGVLPPPFQNGWEGLTGGLRALAANEQFENWVFVFGTAIGASFAEQWGSDATAINFSFVQRGGLEHQEECHYVEKHLKSWMDFIVFNLDHPAFFDGDVNHDSRDDRQILDRLIYENGDEGGCLFSFEGICRDNGQPLLFGLEICLDHAQSFDNGTTGRLAEAGERVDIQLVPSCGMSLIEESLSLAPAQGPRDTSYALNCDGFGCLDRPTPGGHIELWHQVLDENGAYQVEVLQEVPGVFDDPDETPPPPDDPKESRHFLVPDGPINLEGRVELDPEVQAALGIDLKDIRPDTLWRSHGDFPKRKKPLAKLWPSGLGFIRRLPSVPL